MRCERIRSDELIESYLSKRLDEAVSDELETHILGCVECSGLLEEYQGVRDELEARAASIRRTTTKSRGFPLWWQLASVFSVVVLIGSLGLFHLKQSHQETAKIIPVNETGAKPAAMVTQLPPKTSASQSGLVKSAAKPSAEPALPHKAPSDVSSVAPIPQSQPTINAASSGPNQQELNPGVSASVPEDTMPKGTESLRKYEDFPQDTATTDRAPTLLTSEQGVELFRIGAAEAPPFAFSGYGQSAKHPKGSKTNSLSLGGGNANTGRVLFQKGMTAYVEGRYGDAIEFLKSAAQKDEKTDDINFYLGVSQIMIGRPQEAEITLVKVIALGNSVYLQSAHYYLGKAYVQQMRLAQAESQFRKAAALPGQLNADSTALLARIVAVRAQLETK